MLTLEAHRESGGVQGAIAKRAESVYEGLSVDAQSIAQRMMLRLTQPGEGTEDTRRRVPMHELLTRPSESAAVEQVVAKFADARLVTTSAKGETRSIEVAHEALIRGWPRLRRWIDEDRAGLRLHRRLTESAQEWQRLDRDPGLLYRGGRLAEAIDWRQRYAAVLNDAEREFLDASAALQAKEAGMARRRTRIAVGGLAAAVAILGALAVAAWHERDSALKAKAIALAERDQAEQARKLAQVRQLVAQAQLNQTGSSLLVSTLLAAEAMRRAPSLESDQLVRRGLALLPQPIALMAHDGAVVRVVFSPDGRHLATASRDKTARVWEAVSGRTVTRVTHEGQVNDVVFSTNGLRFATASDDGSARVWETASGREIMRGATGSSVNRVALSPDGRYLAAACSDRTAHVWEIADGREIARLVHYDVVNAVAFSPDGQHVATASGYPSSRLIASAKRDDNVRVWTLQGGGREVWRGAHDHNVWAVAFSPDGKYLASASADGTARLWDVNTGRELARLPHEDRVGAIAFSNDSGFLATAVAGFLPIATHDRTARVWEVPSGREVLRVAHESDVNAVAFNPDATLLATASQDGTARLWDRTGREILRVASHAGGVSVVGFSPDGSLFATASHDGAVRLWRTFARWEFAQITFGGDVNAAIFSPDAKYLVASGTDKTARVLELSTGKEIARLAHGGAVHMLAFSPDSRHIAVAGSDTGEKDFTVRVWDVASKRVVCEVVHDDYVQAIAFSPDGKLLATASKDNNARVWDAVSGQEVLQLPHEKSIFGIVFSRDGRYLATRAEDHSVRLWDLSTGRQVAQMRHKNVVAAFAFSPTGELFATASWDRTARIWEVPSGRLIVTIANERELTAIAFSPDGQSVATADGGTTRILEAASGRELARLADAGASTLAFSPDGRHIATGGFRRMVRVWEVTTGRTVAGVIHDSSVQRIAFDPEGRYLLTTSGDILLSRGHVARVSAWRPADLIAEVCGRLTRNLSIAEWRQHLEAEPYQATCPDIPGHAIDMLKQADDHAASGQRDLAEAGFTEAVRAALRQEDAEIDNAACWFGSIDGFAKIILPACQQAVALANDNMSPQYRDSRGLARALTGDRDGAIEDFKVFAAWAKTSDGNAQSALQREAWMATIQSGGNPFDAETLKALRKQ